MLNRKKIRFFFPPSGRHGRGRQKKNYSLVTYYIAAASFSVISKNTRQGDDLYLFLLTSACGPLFTVKRHWLTTWLTQWMTVVFVIEWPMDINMPSLSTAIHFFF